MVIQLTDNREKEASWATLLISNSVTLDTLGHTADKQQGDWPSGKYC